MLCPASRERTRVCEGHWGLGLFIPQSRTRHYSVLRQLERFWLGLEMAPNVWAWGHGLPAIVFCSHLEQLMPSEHHSVSWAAGFSLASGRGTCGLVLHLIGHSITCVTPDSLWCGRWLFTLGPLLPAWLYVWEDWLVYVGIA